MKYNKELKTKPTLAWTINDHKLTHSTPPKEFAEALQRNPQTTHGEMMTREKAVAYVKSNRESLVELGNGSVKTPSSINELEKGLYGNIRYLHVLGKLHHEPELVKDLHEKGILNAETEEQLKEAIKLAAKKSDLESTLNDHYLCHGSPPKEFEEMMRKDPTKSIGELMTHEEAENHIRESLEFVKEINLLKHRKGKLYEAFLKDIAHLHSKDKLTPHRIEFLRKNGYLK